MSQNIEKIVSDFLKQRTAVTRIDRTKHLFESGIVNSLFLLELLSFLESRFHIEVSMADLDLERFSTIERIVYFVVEKQQKANETTEEHTNQRQQTCIQ